MATERFQIPFYVLKTLSGIGMIRALSMVRMIFIEVPKPSTLLPVAKKI